MERSSVGETTITVNVVEATLAQEGWLLYLVHALSTLKTITNQIFNRLIVALSIQLLLTISVDFSPVVGVRMDSLDWVHLGMSKLRCTLANFQTK